MAGRLREGADTGYRDINDDVIRVGDHLKDSKGDTWRVNSWLQAVPDGEGKAIPVKQLRTTLCELYDPEREKTIEEMPTAAEVAKAAETAEAEEEHPVEAATIESYTDQQLADELRARGYDVSASKQITITL